MRPDELAAIAISAALARVPGLDPASIDDVILGCAMPEGEQGLNVARIASLRAGIPVEASAVTVNRFCSSGLQAIAYGAERIMLGQAPGRRRRRHRVDEHGADGRQQGLAESRRWSSSYPDVYLSTGLVAENHARESAISREAQDAFALRSHQRALAAIEAGRFKDEIVPLHGPRRRQPNGGKPVDARDRRSTPTRARAATPRSRRSAKLKPAFHVSGTVTAGNSSQTSDGAAAVIVTSADAARRSAASRRWRGSSATPPPACRRSSSASARCRRSGRC